MLQDFLTAAATATLYGTIGFIVFGYVAYVWRRTAPVATPAADPDALTAQELAEEGHAEAIEALPALFAQAEAITSSPLYADAPAASVKRRKVSPTPIQEVIAQPKRKRGRPRKAA